MFTLLRFIYVTSYEWVHYTYFIYLLLLYIRHVVYNITSKSTSQNTGMSIYDCLKESINQLRNLFKVRDSDKGLFL